MPKRASKALTDLSINKEKSPTSGRREIFDAYCPGLCIRITPTGHKSFCFYYRLGGKNQRLTLGPYPGIKIKAARRVAGDARTAVSEGRNPALEKRERQDAPQTFRDLAQDYLSLHAEKKKSAESLRNDRAMLGIDGTKSTVLKKFGHRAIDSITARDIHALHASMEKTPYRANRMLAVLSKMFTLAVHWKLRPDNPCKGVERYPEEPRTRYLSPTELGRLSEALNEHHDQAVANAVRLLILTGARRGEVLGATWAQFDLDNGVWVKPSSHTKQKREHRVPLSPAAIQLLHGMKRKGDYLFPGRTRGTHLLDIKKSWAQICKQAKLDNVRLHDLRHTYASTLASSGASLLIIGQLLGHTQANTTLRYSHLFDDTLREATGKVGAMFENVSNKRDNVEPLRKGS